MSIPITNDELFKDIENFLMNKEELKQIEFQLWLKWNNIILDEKDSKNPDDYDSFVSYTSDFKLNLLGYYNKPKILIIIENIKRRYLYSILKEKFKDKEYDFFIIYPYTALTEHLLYLVYNFELYKSYNDNLFEFYDKVYSWMKKRNVNFIEYKFSNRTRYIPIFK